LLSKLRPFQRKAVDFALQNGTGRILLGDEMGLGKTLTSLAIMLSYQQTEFPLLILCPASLRYTWPAEIEKVCPWIPSTAIYCVKGKDDVGFAGEIIVTYSLLQERFQIANILKECNFQCIIADESHNLKQLSSQRCQLALPLLQNSKRLLLLSGTPALNRPVELWPQVHALDPKGKMFGKYGMRYNDYTKRYCNAKRTRFGWDVNGSSNADELHACLKTVMIRRLKSEVLHDLPSKQRAIVPVTISARQAVSEIMDGVSDDMANSAHFEARRLLNQAYQAIGIAKAPASTEYIVDWLDGSDSSQKLVVFAHHKEVLDYIETTISAKYKGRMGMIRIDGSVPPADRALRVRKFQTNDSIRLAILSMTAAGVGLTLTAASSIIFTELHWVPGVLAQAEDRCHRIGQVNAVNIMYAICKDEDVSVDRSLWAMLGRKV
ncbi:THAPSDRAFT_263934, partial [Thalassiosira pseudonana CCMP1335]